MLSFNDQRRKEPQNFILRAIQQQARLKRVLHHGFARRRSSAATISPSPRTCWITGSRPGAFPIARGNKRRPRARDRGIRGARGSQGPSAPTGTGAVRPRMSSRACRERTPAPTSSRARMAARGRPAAKGLATTTMSGRRPNFENAKKRPVRPRPHWISSQISSAPCRAAKFLGRLQKILAGSPLRRPRPGSLPRCTAATRGVKLSRRWATSFGRIKRTARRQRLKRLAILFRPGRGQRTERAAVKRIFERQNFVALERPGSDACARKRAPSSWRPRSLRCRNWQRRRGPAGETGEFLRQWRLIRVVKQVRNVQQSLRCVPQHRHDFRVGIAQGIYGQPPEEIQILLPVSS